MSNSPRFLSEYKDIYEDYIIRNREALTSSYWHIRANRLNFLTKTDDFKLMQGTSEGILESLEILISSAEGFRDKPGVQPYINYLVETINLHLSKIEKYYPKNKPSTFKSKEDRRNETKFQQLVFKGEQSIKSTLRKLNVKNDMSDFRVEFFNDVKATLPMKDILCSRFPNIEAKVETLDIDWDLIQDNELFINKNRRDIPDWNDNLHFWDQEKDVLEFWVSEYNKIKKGIYIDNLYINGWLYYHINFFKTPIGDEKDEILTPKLRDNEWYLYKILTYVQEQIDLGKDGGLAIMGTRRYGKSTAESSWSGYKILTNPTKNGVVAASSEKDILSLTDKIDIAVTRLPPAFNLNMNAKDWTKQVRFGLKTKSGQEIKYFYLDIINIDSGSKRGSQKLAGIAPVLFVMDEFAKDKFIESFNALIPALETSHGWKTIPWYTATGGDEDLSAEADKALSNPKAHRFVNMKWSLLNDMVPKEHRTWEERDFGFFIPAQMGQRTGHRKVTKKLSEFLNIDSQELSKIEIQVTDWEHNTKVCKDKRKSLSGSKVQLQMEKVYYPLDPNECFLSAKNNPYPSEGIKIHQRKLMIEGDPVYGTAKKIGLRRKEDGSVEHYLDVTREVATFPHEGGFIDSPFLLYDSFPTSPPRDPYRYVAGMDDYKHEQSDGDSVGAFYIFDRLKKKIVLGLASRPDPHKSLHKQIHMALDAYNAKCFPENEDMDIKKYLDRITNPDFYLYKGFDAYSDFAQGKFQSSRKFGWQPNKNTTPIVRGYTIEYATDDVEFENEDNDIKYTVSGYERIEDVQLLEEMIKYKSKGNFDRLVAFGSCLAIDYYLTATWRTPSIINNNKEPQFKRDMVVKKNKYFSNRRRGYF